MKCVVLAAGEGKRMHPLTYTRPKVMLPIANKPILEWNLMHAKAAGLNDFLFIIGYKAEMVREHFGDGNNWNVHINYVNQGKALGTAHAIGMVESFVDDFLVLSGDTIFGTNDIKAIVNQPQSMGVVKVENPGEYGVVETSNDTVKKIHEKMDQPLSNLINAGIYHFPKAMFKHIHATTKSPRGEYEITDSINMFTQKQPLKSITLKTWRDVGYPWHLLEATEDILKKMKQKIQGTIEPQATLIGDVSVGKGTIIRNGSYIQGPIVIGDNCIIGPNCYLRPYTTIGNNCHVGNACEVKNSIIMDNTNIPHQNYVGDSIIGEGCNLGSGTKVANLRLDKKPITVTINGKRIHTERRKLGVILGDNVQTGINAMMNVGSVIGNNVFIGPGALTNGEIQPETRVF